MHRGVVKGQQMMLYPSIGLLRYSGKTRLVVEVDPVIGDYYRSLIPKYLNPQRPRWGTHITVVREEKETPVNTEAWGKYDGQPIEFFYSPEIHTGKIYFWLLAYCVFLEEIRAELGLPVVSQYTLPPDGFQKAFHITVGNLKM